MDNSRQESKFLGNCFSLRNSLVGLTKWLRFVLILGSGAVVIASCGHFPDPNGIVYDTSNTIVKFDGNAVKRVAPMYPLALAQQGIVGKVVVEVIINERGWVVETKVVESTPTGAFDNAVRHAISQWRYKPATLDGKPVRYKTVVTMTFELEN